MTTQLKNVQHDFETGVGMIGATVRLGSKWSKQPVGTIVDLWQCDRPHAGDCPAPAGGDAVGPDVGCVRRGQAQIVGHWCGELIDLPTGVLALEHETASRTWDGLVASLRRAYGDLVAASAKVTALLYLRIS